MRRIISIILAMLMMVSMCTFVSFGASAEDITLPTEPTLEELTVTDGYTPLTLDMIFTEGRQGVEQKSDFDMAGKYYLTENITLPQTLDGTFTGELHGNGKTITVTTGPVFSNISGATVSNVKLVTDADGISVTEADHIAILAAIGGAVTVENVITEGTVKNTSATSVTASAAGLIGMLSSENESTLTNCYNKAAVTGMNADQQGTAGIVGLVAAGQLNLVSCVNTGAINGFNDAAGIVCYAKEFVDAISCINAGVVKSGNDAAGGIMAHTLSGFSMAYCHNENTITAGGNAAAGIVANMLSLNNVDRSIVCCTNEAAVTGKAYVGGIVGYFNGGIDLYIDSCMNTADITATAANGEKHGAAGICCYAATYVTVENCYNSGTIYCAGPRQAAGIVGYVLDGAKITDCHNSGDCTVVVLSDGQPTTTGGAYTATMAAGILAYAKATANEGVEVYKCSNSGDMSSYERAGGIVGHTQSLKEFVVSDCVNSGKIEVAGYDEISYAGGILGSNGGAADKSEIVRCINKGDVYIYQNHTGNKRAGGIAGLFNGRSSGKSVRGLIANCQTIGNVYGEGDYVAGIFAEGAGNSGANDRGIRIEHCGVFGVITAKNGTAVGLSGHNDTHIIEAKDNFVIATLDGKVREIAFVHANQVIDATTGESTYGLSVDDFNANYLLDEYPIAFTGYVNKETEHTHPYSELAEGYAITSADVASGKLAYLMQEATGAEETIWGQSIGTDPIPVLFGDRVVKYGDAYINAYLDYRYVALDEGFKYIVVAKAPETAKVTFTFNGATEEVEGEVYGNTGSGKYKYEFESVGPQFIAKDITVNFYVGDELIETYTESILDYCEAAWRETESGSSTETLIEKVYLYGVAARDYVVAKGLYTAEELPEVTSELFEGLTAGEVPVHTEDLIYKCGEGGIYESATFVSANVIFDSTNKIVIKFKLADGVDPSTVTINGKAIGTPDANGIYTYTTNAIYACNYNDDMSAYRIAVNGEYIVELYYNVCIYASRMANNDSASAAMKALAVATYEYGVAAGNVPR